MATSQNTSRPATVTRLHVQQSVASGRRGTDGGLDRAGVPWGRAPDTLPHGSEPQFPPRMTAGTLDVGSGWAAPSSVHEAFTGGGRATAAASFPCTSPSSSFILPHAGSPCAVVRGPLGAHSRDPAPQRTRPALRTAGRRGPGPGHPVPTGAGAQTGGASRRLRETLLAGDPGPPSATGPQVPAIPLWAKARSCPGNTECVPRRGLDWPLSSPLSPLGRQRWEAASLAGSLSWLSLPSLPPPPPPCVI